MAAQVEAWSCQSCSKTSAALAAAAVDVELNGRLTRGRAVSWPVDDTGLKEGLDLQALPPIDVTPGVDNDRFVAFLLGRLANEPDG